MKKIILALLCLFLIAGCSSSDNSLFAISSGEHTRCTYNCDKCMLYEGARSCSIDKSYCHADGSDWYRNDLNCLYNGDKVGGVCFPQADSYLDHVGTSYLECCKTKITSSGFDLTAWVSGNDWYWANDYAYHWDYSCSEVGATKVSAELCGTKPVGRKEYFSTDNFICKNAIVTNCKPGATSLEYCVFFCDLDDVAYCPDGCENGACVNDVVEGCTNPIGFTNQMTCINRNPAKCLNNQWVSQEECGDYQCMEYSSNYADCKTDIYYCLNNNYNCISCSYREGAYNSLEACKADINYCCISPERDSFRIVKGGCFSSEFSTTMTGTKEELEKDCQRQIIKDENCHDNPELEACGPGKECKDMNPLPLLNDWQCVGEGEITSCTYKNKINQTITESRTASECCELNGYKWVADGWFKDGYCQKFNPWIIISIFAAIIVIVGGIAAVLIASKGK